MNAFLKVLGVLIVIAAVLVAYNLMPTDADVLSTIRLAVGDQLIAAKKMNAYAVGIGGSLTGLLFFALGEILEQIEVVKKALPKAS